VGITDKIIGYLYKLAVEAYNALEEKINVLPNPNPEIKPMRQIEKGMLLRVIDTFWIEHLETMG